jgi:hypothetical protein
MTWYAAHVVMVVKYKRGPQRKFPVWENVLLLRADTEEQAFAKAEALGQAAAGDDDGTFRWRGKAARWELAGVRKIVACCVNGSSTGDGDEITYNELEFSALKDVTEFAAGLPATARYDEQLRVLRGSAQREAKRGKKRA